jgi:hypothetical protein
VCVVYNTPLTSYDHYYVRSKLWYVESCFLNVRVLH